MVELFRRQTVERRGHTCNRAERVSICDLEGDGIDLDGPLCLRGFLFDRKTNGHVERVSAAHLGDFAEVWEDQLEGLCDAFGGDHAQLPEEVGSPGKHLSRDGGEDDAVRRSAGDVGDLLLRERRNKERRLRVISVNRENGRDFRVGFVCSPQVHVCIIGLFRRRGQNLRVIQILHSHLREASAGSHLENRLVEGNLVRNGVLESVGGERVFVRLQQPADDESVVVPDEEREGLSASDLRDDVRMKRRHFCWRKLDVSCVALLRSRSPGPVPAVRSSRFRTRKRDRRKKGTWSGSVHRRWR